MQENGTLSGEIATHRIPTDLLKRSIAKALTWRVVGTLDTFVLSFVVISLLGPIFGMEDASHKATAAKAAGLIAITEAITKIVLYSVHERAWAIMRFGLTFNGNRRVESYWRSVVKTGTWRVVAFLDTMFLAWIFTGDILVAFSIGGFEILTKLFLYFIHERVWTRISFGLAF